jgi:hypothetical protein
LRKTVDDEALVSCAGWPGLIREEVWVDVASAVNLTLHSYGRL